MTPIISAAARLTSRDCMRRVVYLRDLVRVLVARDIKLRYKRSVIGVGWSLLVPLAQLLTLSFVFRLVVPLGIPQYTTFLYSGLLPWTWFQSSLMSATFSSVDNRELVHQVGFPVGILPLIAVTSQLVHFLLAMPVLFLFSWIDQRPVTLALAALPLVIAVQFLLNVSLAYFVSPLQAIFHDTQHLLGIFLTLLFYLTPVFYEATSVPPRYEAVYNLNPLVYLLQAYRRILLAGELPEVMTMLRLGGYAVLLLVLGYRFYMRLHFRLVQEM